MVPDTVRSLFWDVDLTTFEPAAYPDYTIERVLELGDEIAVQWLRRLFDTPTIAATLRRSRRLSARSANYWALVFDVPRSEITVLNGNAA